MSYIIRSKLDQRSMLALPAQPGGAVRWVDPVEGIAPWTFPTKEGAEKARDMIADCGEAVAMREITYPSAPHVSFTEVGTLAATI